MGRQTTILQVFVASPSDLRPERSALESIIRELNQMHSESTGAYLDLVKWETHTVPGFGSDPQTVINEQIGDRYDIFIGMLSTKFGSPTPRAGSGTEEEFERAYERFINNPTELRIMFYFKDPELKASELDLDEYRRVKEFQKKLEQKGLYSVFSSTDEFVAMVRLHLSRQLQEWAQKKWGGQITQTIDDIEALPTEAPVSTISSIDDEDLGLLDLVEIGNENVTTGTASLARITQAITDVGNKTAESTPRFKDAVEQNDIAKQKQILHTVARALEEFGLRIDAELPIFSNSYSTAIDITSKTAILWDSDFKMGNNSSIQSAHDQLESLLAVIVSTMEATLRMEQIVSALPRVTANFNRAKKCASQSLAGLNRALSSSHNLTTEALKEMKRILSDE